MNKVLLYLHMPFRRRTGFIHLWVLFFLLLEHHVTYAQYENCPSISTDITTNPKVCSLYGDASGNSTWDWTVDGSNPDYCTYWQARTNSTANGVIPIGSPFVHSTTGKILHISDIHDYTREKGWELLARDFGCSHITRYPYFILYNRYSGLMRIFIYQSVTSTFSGMSVGIQPVGTPYPATTAAGDSIQAAPDKYLSTTSTSTIGRSVIAVSESPGGSDRWTLVEFDPSFDPNVGNAVYSGAALQFTIYGVQNYALQAKIGGTLVSTTSPGLNFSPSTPPTPNGTGLNLFTLNQQKFTTFGKDLSDIKTNIKSLADGISSSLAGADSKSAEGTVKKDADDAKAKTAPFSDLTNYFGSAGAAFSIGGTILKLAGTFIGLFSGGNKTPAAAPVYTNVDLTLNGSLTLQDVTQTFILRVPGTMLPNGNDATYYQCPLGIFNLVSTPLADTVMYDRWTSNGVQGLDDDALDKKVTFVNYRIKNDVLVSYFDGTGLDLVSAQAAIMAKIKPGTNGQASYNPFDVVSSMTHSGLYDFQNVNYLRPEFDAGRLEMTVYDTSSLHLHLFQTPFVNLECIKGQSIEVPKSTTVFLRVRAVLKRKDDPANTPIYFVQDFMIDGVSGGLSAAARAPLSNKLTTNLSLIANAPYANYTAKNVWVSDITVNQLLLSAVTISADRSITAGSAAVIATSGNIIFKAGNAVYLEPGFTVPAGRSFQAVINNYGAIPPTCGTIQKQAFQSTNPCFSTTAAGQSQKPAVNSTSPGMMNTLDSSTTVTFYPNPAQESLTISGLEGWGRSTITVYDQTGRKLFTVSKQDESPTLQLNVASLSGGVYFVEVQGDTKKLTHKFIIAR